MVRTSRIPRFAFASLVFVSAATAQFVYLSDIPYVVGGVWEGRPVNDVMYSQEPSNTTPMPIKVRGVTYSKGVWGNLYWNANQVIAFDTRNKYTRFTAVIGITDAIDPNACEWCYDSLNIDKYACVWRPPCYGQGNCEERNRFVCVGAGASVRIVGLVYSPRDTIELLAQTAFYRYTPTAIRVDVSNLQNIDRVIMLFDPRHTEQLNAPYRRGLSAPVDVGRNPFFDHVAIADAKLYKVTTAVAGGTSTGNTMMPLVRRATRTGVVIAHGTSTYSLRGECQGPAQDR